MVYPSIVKASIRASMITVLLASSATVGHAQSAFDGFWTHWFDRSDHSKSDQPHWITPLATTTPRLEQEFRYDVQWQKTQPGAPYAENYGNTKGLELIPFENVEIIAAVPPYVVHHAATARDGFGDFQLLVKYRL